MRRRTAKILSGIAVVIVALGIVYGVAVAISTAKLQRAYAALQADGRPMDRKQIIPPAVADTNNAALLYESAISLLQATPAEHNRQSPPDASRREQMDREKCDDLLSYLSSLSGNFGQDAPTPEMQQELRQLMSHPAVDHALFAIEQGVQRPTCRQQCDYNAGLRMTLPNLNGLKSLGSVVGVKARLEADSGEMNRAWHWATVQAKMADALRTQPTIVSQLVRMSAISLSCETIQHLSEVAPPTKVQHQQIEAILSTFDDSSPLAHAVDGERLLFGERLFTLPKHDLYKELWEFIDSGPSWSLIPWVVKMRWLTFKPFLLADHANYVRIMHENAKAVESPFPVQESRQVDGGFTLTAMLAPALNRVRVSQLRATAKTRVTRVGLALLQYHVDHGAFPATLDVLNTDAASDPFTQSLLHYRVEGDGFVLYSVGEDREDNGGTAKPPKKGNAKYDLVWRYPGPDPAMNRSNQ
jgi:hypothetical protein